MWIIWFLYGGICKASRHSQAANSQEVTFHWSRCCWCFLTKIHITLKYTLSILVWFEGCSHFFLQLLAFGSRTCDSPQTNSTHLVMCCLQIWFMIPCPSDFRSIMSTCLFQPSWNNSKTLYVNECFVRKRWLAPLSSASSISRNLWLSSSGHLPFLLCLCSLCDLAAVLF